MLQDPPLSPLMYRKVTRHETMVELTSSAANFNTAVNGVFSGTLKLFGSKQKQVYIQT